MLLCHLGGPTFSANTFGTLACCGVLLQLRAAYRSGVRPSFAPEWRVFELSGNDLVCAGTGLVRFFFALLIVLGNTLWPVARDFHVRVVPEVHQNAQICEPSLSVCAESADRVLDDTLG